MMREPGYWCWLVLVTSCLVCSTRVFGQDQNNAIDLNSPVCKIISLPYLVGQIGLSLGETKVVEKMMPCFLKLWEEQLPNAPAANIELSNTFLFVMGENPEAFFSAMVAQPKVFGDWLAELQKLSFTSPEKPACDLEAKRKQLIYLLENASIVGSKNQALRRSTISRLSEIPNDRECFGDGNKVKAAPKPVQ